MIYLPTSSECDPCGMYLYEPCEGQCTPTPALTVVKPYSTGAVIRISWRGGRYWYRRTTLLCNTAASGHTVLSAAASCPTYPPANPADYNHCFGGCCEGVSHAIISDALFESLFPSDPNDPEHPTTDLCIKTSDGCCYCGHTYVVNPVSHTSATASGATCGACDYSACSQCIPCNQDLCDPPSLQYAYAITITGSGSELNGSYTLSWLGECRWFYAFAGFGFASKQIDLEWNTTVEKWVLTCTVWLPNPFGGPATCTRQSIMYLGADPCDPSTSDTYDDAEDTCTADPPGNFTPNCGSISGCEVLDGSMTVVISIP